MEHKLEGHIKRQTTVGGGRHEYLRSCGLLRVERVTNKNYNGGREGGNEDNMKTGV